MHSQAEASWEAAGSQWERWNPLSLSQSALTEFPLVAVSDVYSSNVKALLTLFRVFLCFSVLYRVIAVIMDTNSSDSDVARPSRSRKKVRRPETWAQNVAKQKRNKWEANQSEC